MAESSPLAQWAEAFTAAQADMPDITKSKKATIQTKGGGSFSYAYADLPEIIERVRPALTKHGLSVAQSVEPFDSNHIAVNTRIYHRAGHVESFGPVVLPSGGDARQVGSAITYARRYGLCAALGIAADEDDDGQAAVSKSGTDTKNEGSRGEVGPASVPATSDGNGGSASVPADVSSLIETYGQGKVLTVARRVAQANNLAKPLSEKDITEDLARLVTKQLENA